MRDVSWKLLTSLCVCTCLIFGQLEPALFAKDASDSLKISVLGGQNAVLDGRRRQEIVVRVLDGAVPAAAVDVMFAMPATGPSGQFRNGESSLIVRTDAQGLAHSGTILSNSLPGTFNVTVMASLAGATARAEVQQSNQAEPATEQEGRSSRKKWLLIGAAALGGAAAAILLTRDKKQQEVSITAGDPSVGQQ